MAGLQNRLPQKEKKKNSTARQGSEHDNMMKERRRQPSRGQIRKMNTWQIQIILTQVNQYHARIFVHA